MDDLGQLPTWPTLSVEESQDFGIFSLKNVRRRSPRTGRDGVYRVLEMPSWVNVVAVTEGGEVVLVEQFRHGIDILTLEIPGGMVDPGEDAAVAAARELLEETGFAGEEPRLLGEVHPNPAIQDNICTTYQIDNARCIAPPSPDEGEHIAVHLAPLEKLPELVQSGMITHSLVIAAFYWMDRTKAGKNT